MLPLLREENPAVDAAILGLAESARELFRDVERAADLAQPRERAPGAVVFELGTLRALGGEARLLLLEREAAFLKAGVEANRTRLRNLDAVLAKGAGRVAFGGVTVEVSAGLARLTGGEDEAPAPFAEQFVNLPGVTKAGGHVLQAATEPFPEQEGAPPAAAVPAARVEGALRLRRPFAGADEMNKAMVDRWNDVVAVGDEVWIVGDLVLGQLTVNLSAHVWRLKGRKILVPGNHDACWQGQKKGARQITAYLDLGGIARIVDDPAPVEIAGQRVQVNHFPYDPGEPGRPARFARWRPEDSGGWLLCGHIHERWRQHGKQINVGVDAWNFAPVADDTIAEMIESGPARRPCPVYARTR